jgi:hypothetical protein
MKKSMIEASAPVPSLPVMKERREVDAVRRSRKCMVKITPRAKSS